MPKNNDVQRHSFQLTINNPEKNGFDQETIKKELIDGFSTLDYFCMADEIGEQGTYHTHVYVHFTSRVRFSKVKKHFPPAHIEAAKGPPESNVNYIRKSGKWENTDKAETSVKGSFFEWGTMPTSQGGDFLMQQLYRLVDEGYTDGEIIAFNSDYIRFLDTIAKLRKTMLIEKYREKRRLDLRVHYIFGESGTGKTRYVLDTHGDANVYRVTDYDHPYDSYEMQPVICYDEYRSSLKISHMLDALDIYPLELPARYSNRYACYETVYIVSNWSLEQQYREIQLEHRETWNAFLRRIHTVTYFGKNFGKNGTIEKYASVQDYFCRRLDALIESTGTDANAGANTEESSDEESQKAFPLGKKISD